jgi:hypothetical protein
VDREIELHRRLEHPHAVSFWLAFDDGTQRHIVMEWCARGTLRHAMGRVSEQQLRAALVVPLLQVLVLLEEQVGGWVVCTGTTLACAGYTTQGSLCLSQRLPGSLLNGCGHPSTPTPPPCACSSPTPASPPTSLHPFHPTLNKHPPPPPGHRAPRHQA